MTKRGVRKSQWMYLGLVLNGSFGYARDDEMGRSAQVPAGVPGAVAV